MREEGKLESENDGGRDVEHILGNEIDGVEFH